LATADDYRKSKYVVSAGPETWAGLFSGKGDVLSHILRRRLKLKKGSASGLRQHITAARALIEAAGRISYR
jgi:putative sterol carrier protein